MTIKVYTLTLQTEKMRRAWFKKAEFKFGPHPVESTRNAIQCWACGKETKQGDKVVSKIGGGVGRSHLYHFSCAKRKLLV